MISRMDYYAYQLYIQVLFIVIFEPLKEVLSEDCNLCNVGTHQYSPITLFLCGKPLNDRYVSDAEVTKP